MNRYLRAALVFFVVFVGLAVWANSRSGLESLDDSMIVALSRSRHAGLSSAARLLSHLFDMGASVLLFILGLMYVARRLGAEGASRFFALGVSALVLSTLEKQTFFKTRPTLVAWMVSSEGSSFPSGHLVRATALLLGLCFLMESKWERREKSVQLYASALVVGLLAWAQVYLGVNYPSDVVAGACLGLAWVLALLGLWSLRDQPPPVI
ncbi:MAG: phosphatase PAP2 family protein [Bdellovibrionales bacterium]|nr:phosphatase PAP2 family protein [Bdellovibrionales bacterium]